MFVHLVTWLTFLFFKALSLSGYSLSLGLLMWHLDAHILQTCSHSPTFLYNVFKVQPPPLSLSSTVLDWIGEFLDYCKGFLHGNLANSGCWNHFPQMPYLHVSHFLRVPWSLPSLSPYIQNTPFLNRLPSC